MKYKVGDKVRIRRDLDVNKSYVKDPHDFCVYVEGMKDVAEKNHYILTIEDINSDNDRYFMLEENEDYNWTDEMIEGLAENISNEIEKFEAFLREVADATSNGYISEWEILKALCNGYTTYGDISKGDADGFISKLVNFYKTFEPKPKKKKVTMAELRELVGEDFEIVD